MSEDGSAGADPRARFRVLPEPIRLEDTIESQDARTVPDLAEDEDPNRAAALRFPFAL